jgi:hypothetical protein
MYVCVWPRLGLVSSRAAKIEVNALLALLLQRSQLKVAATIVENRAAQVGNLGRKSR